MKEIKNSIKILEKVFENENGLLELREKFYSFKAKFEKDFENLEYIKNRKIQMDISEQMGDICDEFLDEIGRIMNNEVPIEN
jgi:hypothetical protein